MADPKLADLLPNYEVGDELGRGAMGEVLAGRHTRLDRDVAIKRLPASFAADPDVRSRFGDEARVLASLTHPHIVPVYDYVEEDGVCLLVMEALPGGTVWDRFTSTGLSMPTACAVVLAACAGLQHAHDKRVLHRDVKPDNLMFDAENTLKVTDFGIATALGGNETLATVDGQILGTPAYMAPEQADGSAVGPPADVYAAGTMLYELLSGRLPFDEGDDAVDLLKQRLTRDPLPLDQASDQVPAPLVDAVMHALTRSAADRYASPADFATAIDEAATEAWGSDWLTHADLRLLTGTPSGSGARPTGPATTPVREGSAPGTVAPGETADRPSASETVAPDDASATPSAARETVAPDDVGNGADIEGGSRETVGLDAAGAAAAARPTTGLAPPSADLIQSTAPARRDAGPDLADVDADELVSVADVLQPPSPPWSGLAAAIVLLLAMIGIGFAGLGDPARDGADLSPGQIEVEGIDLAGEDPVAADLADPIRLVVREAPAGVRRAEIALTAGGVPIGSSSTEDLLPGAGELAADLSATSARLVSAGAITAELRLLDEGGSTVLTDQFELEPDQPPWFSAIGIVSVILLLIVLAYASSLSQPLRRGRRHRSAYPGLAIVGGLGGFTTVLGAWTLGGAEPTTASVIAAAVLGAIGFVTLGWTMYRFGRRRRLKPAT